MSELRKSIATNHARQPHRSTVWTAAGVIVVLFIANLGALIDAVLHPDIDYFDLEHWIVGLASAFIVGTILVLISVYVRRIENVLRASRQTGDALRQSEDSLRALLNAVTDSMMLIEPDGTVVAVNEITAARLNTTVAKMLGHNAYDFVSPEVTAHRRAYADQVIATGQPVRFEDERFGRWIDNSIYPVSDEQGRVVRLAIYGRDITPRRQAEIRTEMTLQALHKSEASLRAIFENSLQSLMLIDRERRVQMLNRVANERATAIYGRDIHLGDSIYQFIPPQNQAGFEQLFEQVLAGESIQLERSFTPGGLLRQYEYHIAPIRADDGSVTGVFLSMTDVTDRRQAEDDLRTNRDYLQAVLDSTNDAVFVDDADTGQIIDVNQRMCELYGYTREEALHTPIGDLSQGEPPYSQAEALDWLLKARHVGPQTFEWLAKRKDGQLFWAEVSIRFAMFGNDARYVVTVRDIAERKRAEAALRESEERFRLAFDTNPDAVNINRLVDGLFVDINQGFTALTGYTRQDVIGKTSLEIDIWHNPADRQRLVQQLQTTGYCENLEAQFRQKDGSLTTALMSARVIALQGVPHILSITRDITERKRAEEALRESEELLSLFMQHSPIYAYIKEVTPTESRVLKASENFREMIGIPGSEMAGKTMAELFSAEFAAKMTADDWAVVSSGIALKLDEDLNGRHYATIKFPILRGGRNLLAGYTIDMTDRKRAEEAVRESEQRLRAIVDNAPFGAHLYELGPAQRLVFSGANRAADSILGVSHAPFIGKTIEEAFPALGQTDIPDAYRRAAATGERYDADQVDYAEGSIRGAFEVHAFQTGPNRMAVFFRDITERKQAEEAEREARQLAEALRDTATALNTSLELDDVLERALINVRRVVPHDGANILLVDGDEARVVRVHGRCRTETVNTERYTISATPNLRTMRATGEPCIIDHTHDNDDWQTLPHYDWIASYAGAPIYAADGQLVGYLGLYSTQPDHFTSEHTQRLKMFAAQAALAIQNAQLHARIQEHAEELEERVRQRTRQLSEANARLSELDRLKDSFISRISHELRTPLTSIKIYLELLESGKPEKRAKYMQVLTEQSDRLQQLIESLLNVTQQGASAADLKVVSVDLNHVAESLAADVAPRAAQRSLTFNTALATGLPWVAADAILLAQALSNIVANALNYTPAGGTIDLATAQVIDRGDTWITVTIRDTGPGIGPDELPHIFDRFYRGRAAADYKTPGAGVGLFISHDILTALGGRLTVDSQSGVGATFTAWLRPA